MKGRMKSSRPSSDIAPRYLVETAAFHAKRYFSAHAASRTLSTIRAS
jgi:hypothetical protein